MDKLQEARLAINKIDETMADLFQKRMQCVEEVILYKQQHEMNILDSSREQEVIKRNLNHVQDKKYHDYYRMFMTDVMKVSRSYQQAVIGKNRVGYAGTKGAFSNIASVHLFPEGKQKAYPNFEDIFKGVAQGEIHYGVIPFENSYTGEVGEILDLLMHYDVHITKLYDLKIHQNLLGIKGTKLSEIKQIYSKDQALSQCHQFLRGRDIELIPYPNTALAAEYVAMQKDKSKAAIASQETAEIFDLEILEENIESAQDNTTRFIVIEKELQDKGNHFNVMFTLPHNAGTLANVMQVIAEGGFNMESIKSRSLKNQPWKYYFYIEVVGNPFHEKEKVLLQSLESVCEELKVLGCYESESRDGQ